jgi:hypothetical protein
VRFRTWSYRFAEEVLNSKLTLKKEIENIIKSISFSPTEISRPKLNAAFKKAFLSKGWKGEERIFEEPREPLAKIDFIKERVGVEVAFSHSSFLGIDMLKFQTLSYSNLNRIDIGIYIIVTKGFHKKKFEGSITFEKVVKYLPHFRSAIQVPIYVYGLEE